MSVLFWFTKFNFNNYNLSCSFSKLFVLIFQWYILNSFNLSYDFYFSDSFSLFFDNSKGKNFFLLDFGRYYFNLFLRFLNSYLNQEISKKFFLDVYNSFSSIDLFIRGLFNDFLIKYMFLSNSLVFLKYVSPIFIRNFFVKSNLVSILNIKKLYSFNIVKVPFLVKFEVPFESYFPKFLVFRKLSKFGILHNKKFRAIAFLKFIFMEDMIILKYFNSICFSFLFWFGLSVNYSDLLFLISLLRYSCALTLSRKHKKNIIWVYSIFAKEVLFFSTLNENYTFYSLKSFLINIKKGYSFPYFPFCLSEYFFLSI